MFKNDFPNNPDHVFIAPPTFYSRGMMHEDKEGNLILNYLLAQWIPGMRVRDGPFILKRGQNDIFIPAFVNDNHWSLLLVKGQWKTIFYYDSMWHPANGRKLLKATLHVLMEMIGKYWQEGSDRTEIAPWLLDFDPEQWKLVDLGKAVSQQPNGNDCGVYVLYFIFVTMFLSPRHYHVIKPGKNSMNGFRRKLARMLFDRTVDMKDFGLSQFLAL